VLLVIYVGENSCRYDFFFFKWRQVTDEKVNVARVSTISLESTFRKHVIIPFYIDCLLMCFARVKRLRYKARCSISLGNPNQRAGQTQHPGHYHVGEVGPIFLYTDF
jgi:hypothetical protein